MPGEAERARLASDADAAEAPEAALPRSGLRETLEAAITALPPPYRAVLVLRDLEGLSTEETAQALGLTVVTVLSDAARGKGWWRRGLS